MTRLNYFKAFVATKAVIFITNYPYFIPYVILMVLMLSAALASVSYATMFGTIGALDLKNSELFSYI